VQTRWRSGAATGSARHLRTGPCTDCILKAVAPNGGALTFPISHPLLVFWEDVLLKACLKARVYF
jgi:hypothetical protein